MSQALRLNTQIIISVVKLLKIKHYTSLNVLCSPQRLQSTTVAICGHWLLNNKEAKRQIFISITLSVILILKKSLYLKFTICAFFHALQNFSLPFYMSVEKIMCKSSKMLFQTKHKKKSRIIFSLDAKWEDADGGDSAQMVQESKVTSSKVCSQFLFFLSLKR